MKTIIFLLFQFCIIVRSARDAGSDGTTLVSSNGTNSGSCLSGGEADPCNTLGYVLNNTNKLLCSNCSILVTYDHIVYSSKGSINMVNFTSVVYLSIIGINFPRLDFNNNSMLLQPRADNQTVLTLKDMTMVNCGSPATSCTDMNTTKGIFLHTVRLDNLTLTQSNEIAVLVQHSGNISHCHFSHLGIGSAILMEFDSNESSTFIVQDSIFKDVVFIDYEYPGYLLGFLGSSDTTINIHNCTFRNIIMNASGYVIFTYIDVCKSVTVDHCMFYDINVVVVIYTTLNAGIVNVSDNHYEDNIQQTTIDTTDTVLVAAEPQIQNQTCTSAKLYYIGNTFKHNAGCILNINLFNYLVIANNSITYSNSSSSLISIANGFSTPNGSNYTSHVEIKNTTIEYNVIGQVPRSTLEVALVSVHNLNATITGLRASNNIGTPLALVGGTVTTWGNVTINNNTGITGGALYVDDNARVYLDPKSRSGSVNLLHNSAQYGGAVYVGPEQKVCFTDSIFNDVNNSASIAGPDIFSAYCYCNYSSASPCANLLRDKSIVSFPSNVSSFVGTYLNLLAGDTLKLNLSVTDCCGMPTSCLADIMLLCGDSNCPFTLEGSSSVYLHTGIIQTNLMISSNSSKLPQNRPKLLFQCQSPPGNVPGHIGLNITVQLLLSCPLGLAFNVSSQQCQCEHSELDGVFACSNGAACIRRGYWYGNISRTDGKEGYGVVSSCHHSYCNYSQTATCPPDVADPVHYVQLGWSEDEQCLSGHGGTLCNDCTEGLTPSYGGVHCISNDKCRSWHTYVLLTLHLVGVFTVFSMLFMLTRAIGSGYVYGPLFSIAVLNLLPFNLYYPLDSTLSVYAGILLHYKLLGYLPLCFGLDIFSPDLIQMYYLVTVIILVLGILAIAPKCLRKPQALDSWPFLVIIVMMSFWTLGSLVIEALIPMYIHGVKEARIFYKPDSVYLTGTHIAMWLAAVVVLVLLICFVSVVVIFSSVKSYQMQLLLKEFHGNYRDKCQYYGCVYFISWTLLKLSALYSDYLVFQAIMAAVTLMHVFVQPYSRKWLNNVDSVLLFSVLLVSSYILQGVDTYQTKYFATEKKVFVYTLALIPPLYVLLCCILLVLSRLKHCTNNIMSKYRFHSWKPTGYDTSIQDANVMPFVGGQSPGSLRRGERLISSSPIDPDTNYGTLLN